MDKVRVGLIGTGNIARLHAVAYNANPRAQLYALCDTNKERLYQCKEAWGALKVYTDYRDLLADENVDAVEVMTPHNLHAPIGVAALESGKHVSMQKPMAISVKECDALIEAGKKSP